MSGTDIALRTLGKRGRMLLHAACSRVQEHPMTPAHCADQAPIPPPSYHRALAAGLHLAALTLVRRLHVLVRCRLAVVLARTPCAPPPAGPPLLARSRSGPARALERLRRGAGARRHTRASY